MALSDEVAQHVLGEMYTLTKQIDGAIHQIKDIETTLPEVGKSTVDGIAGQTAKLEEASRQIMAHLQELLKTSAAITSAKMKEAREREEMELKHSVGAFIEASIDKAVRKGITRFDTAMATLEIAAGRAEQKVTKAAEAARPGWSMLIIGVVGLSSIVGALVGFLASRVF